MRRSGTKATAESTVNPLELMRNDVQREIKEKRELIRQGILPDESLYEDEAEAAGMSVKACKAFKKLARSGKRLLPDGDWVGFISGIEWEHGSRVPTQIRLMVGGEPIRYDLHVEQPEPVLTFKSNIFKK